MNSIKQYIDFYVANADTIDAVSPQLFNSRRAEAIDALERFIAHGKSKAAVDVLRPEVLFAPDYGININRKVFPIDLSASIGCEVPNMSTLMGVVNDDVFRATTTLERNCPSGLEVLSLSQAATKYPDLIGKHLGHLAKYSSVASAINTLLLQDGIFIHIHEGVNIEKAIQIVNIFNSPASLLASRRILIIADKGASARILLCDHSQRADTDYFSNQIIEVYCHENANVELYDMQEASLRTRRCWQLYGQQAPNSRLSINTNELTGGISANSYNIEVVGDNAETIIDGLVIGSANETISNEVRLHHSSCHSSSRQLFKYALFEEAQGVFGGKIIVDEGALFTDAAQTNRNLLASDNAYMATAPQLEIYCDEVKCSHGATTGQLDPQALFYMQTRGIPESEARLMLSQAFMTDIIDNISFEALRDRLRRLVEKRLSGSTVACASCSLKSDKQ